MVRNIRELKKRILSLLIPIIIVTVHWVLNEVKVSNKGMSYYYSSSFDNPYPHCDVCDMEKKRARSKG